MKRIALLALTLPLLGLTFLACTDAGDPYIPEDGGNGGGPNATNVDIVVMDMVGDWDNLHVNGDLTGDSPVAMTQDGPMWMVTIADVEAGSYGYGIYYDDGAKALVEVLGDQSVTVSEDLEVSGDLEVDLEPAAGTGFNLMVINNNPAHDNIKFKGSYSDPAWEVVDRTGMSEDGVYVYRHVPAGLAEGSYEWGAIQDDGSEFGIWLIDGPNPAFSIDAQGVVSGTTSYEIPSPLPVLNLTFQVDMSNFAGSFDQVQVRGSFNGWNDTPTNMADVGDSIYEVTVEVEENDTVDFKFLTDGANYESVPSECGVDDNFGGFNRQITVGTEDTTYLAPWGECPAGL